jgi:hypothetical protein
MQTKDRLRAEMDKIGKAMATIAVRASNGDYDDYLSPHAMPAILFQGDITILIELCKNLRKRHADGEFDGTTEESEAWAASPEGQATMAKFMEGKKP